MWNQSFACYNKQGNQQKTAALTKLLVTIKNIKQLPCYELQLMNHNINHLENHLLVTRIIYFFQVFVRYSPRQIGLPKGRLLSGTSKPARLMPNKNSPKTGGFFGQKSKGSWWSISNLLNNFLLGDFLVNVRMYMDVPYMDPIWLLSKSQSGFNTVWKRKQCQTGYLAHNICKI